MGQCIDGSRAAAGSADERARDRKLQKDLLRDAKQSRYVKKILLLGAGESGKSTFFKQLVRIHEGGYDEAARRHYTASVHKNVVHSIRRLILACDRFRLRLSEAGAAARESFEAATRGEDDWRIDEKLGESAAVMWADPAIQKAYASRDDPDRGFYMFDGAAHFLNRVRAITKSGYIPDEEDIIRCRIRTSGIVEKTFHIKGNEFRIFDVGGQRAERKKWIHCFQGVTAVLFIASLSSYNQTLFEDSNSNRMTEALLLFEDISNSSWFQDTAMILFLNKDDLFREKVRRVPITVCPSLKDFEGSGYDDSLAYIQMIFELCCQSKNVYTHCTTATDKGNMTAIFEAVQDIVIRQTLKDTALLAVA